ncbi:hypothetical protein L3Q82_025493 [Scortum barcoo]|uniref:Uncharacterized protein n=1 Tax=Scortum barcoo TaxID=214431 RepID=A0ACB8WKU9_9TELE|nr:hypothetical protein L3Q82_025493 [Scortum barcoo]
MKNNLVSPVKRTTRTVTSPGLALPGPGLVGCSLGLCPRDPDRAQPEMATWARLPVGSPPTGRSMRGRCNVVWVAVVAGGLERPNPWTKTLAIGTWNVTSLGGKEPELVREVERYRLEIVGLTSTHSLGSGTQLLERGWTLHYSGVAQGERRRGWCGLAYSSPAQPPCVGVHPGEQRGSLPCAFGLGIGLLLLFVYLRAEQQYRVPGLLGVPGRGT